MIDLFPELFFLNFIHIQIIPDLVFLIFEYLVESVGLLVEFLLFAQLFQLVHFENALVLFSGLVQRLLQFLVGLLQGALLVEQFLELVCEGEEL
jgi:hypothetical protein